MREKARPSNPLSDGLVSMHKEASSVRVSVCIPSYNGEAFIAEAITSVLAQNLQDFECLVVDDCSDDATLEIVNSLSDPKIRVCRNSTRQATGIDASL